MGGGAWPFLVGGVICLVNSDNERDSVLLNSVSLSKAKRRCNKNNAAPLPSLDFSSMFSPTLRL